MIITQHHTNARQYQPIQATRPDLIGIVGFCSYSTVLAMPATAGSALLTNAIQHLHNRIGSGTNIAAGLREAGAMLRYAPRGFRKRVWLLSDGEATDEKNVILPTAEALRSEFVNINTVGFGNQFDRKTLELVSATSHNGRFFQASDIAALTTALMSAAPRHHHSIASKPEVTVFCVDISPSMNEPMGGSTKIATVEAALLGLLDYKRKVFS
jgi:Mg-chelatase subunit ChlD